MPVRVWKQCSQRWLEGCVHGLGAVGCSYSTMHTENQRSRPGVRESQNLGCIDESSSAWAQLLKAFCSHASPLRPEFCESPMSPYNIPLSLAQVSSSRFQSPAAPRCFSKIIRGQALKEARNPDSLSRGTWDETPSVLGEIPPSWHTLWCPAVKGAAFFLTPALDSRKGFAESIKRLSCPSGQT